MALARSLKRSFKAVPKPRWTRDADEHIHSWRYPWANYRVCRRCDLKMYFWHCKKQWKLNCYDDHGFSRHWHGISEFDRARLKHLAPPVINVLEA